PAAIGSSNGRLASRLNGTPRAGNTNSGTVRANTAGQIVTSPRPRAPAMTATSTPASTAPTAPMANANGSATSAGGNTTGSNGLDRAKAITVRTVAVTVSGIHSGADTANDPMIHAAVAITAGGINVTASAAMIAGAIRTAS
ncbi:hypothetical protein QR98_0005190, partial [Sarcoptes scabiei]